MSNISKAIPHSIPLTWIRIESFLEVKMVVVDHSGATMVVGVLILDFREVELHILGLLKTAALLHHTHHLFPLHLTKKTRVLRGW